MRFIPTRIHGVLDYLAGAFLITSPWLLAYAMGGPETWVTVALGAVIIAYSLMTDYELGVVRFLSMRTHLWLDGWIGLFLVWSPTLFGFSAFVWVPQVVVGVFAILLALFTRKGSARRYWPAN
jgi:hypothetical protein